MVNAGKLERDHTANNCEKNNDYNYFQINGLHPLSGTKRMNTAKLCRIYTTITRNVVFFENQGCYCAKFDYHASA